MKKDILLLGLPADPEITVVTIGNADIEIQSYLPYEQIFDMVQWCVDAIITNRTFVSEPVRYMIAHLAICKFYTNLDIDKLFLPDVDYHTIYECFDIIERNNLIDNILKYADKAQIELFYSLMNKTIDSILSYKNSALGIVDTLSANSKKQVSSMQDALDTLQDEQKTGIIMNVLKEFEKLEPVKEA